MIQSRKVRWAGHVACMGVKRCADCVWCDNPKEGLHGRRKDNIKIDIKAVGCEGVEKIYVAQYKVHQRAF
jgi:hypothetical protein